MSSGLAAFVVTYLLHSTVLLGGCWLLTRYVRLRLSVQDALWKAALLGGVATALLASAGVLRPLWQLRVPSLERSEQVAASAPRVAVEAVPDVSVPVEREAATEPMTAPAPSATPSPSVRVTWRGALAGGWLLVSSALFGWWLVRRRRLVALLGVRAVVRDASLQARFDALCGRAGVRSARLTESAACPLPLALTGTEVCVPARFVAELDAEQQEGALAHEVAHLSRRDPAWLLATQVMGAAFFFQPLNLVARRRLRELAESMCDDWAAQQGRGLGLARCLAEVASWLQPRSAQVLTAATPMASRRGGLLQRVERLLRQDAGRERMPGRGVLAVIAGGVLVAAGLAPSLSALPSASVTQSRLPEAVQPNAAVAEDDVVKPPRAQMPVYRVPDPRAPLAQRLQWAEQQAGSRAPRGYWVAYAVRRPLAPNQWYVSDSKGMNISGYGRTDNPIENQLGRDASYSDGTIVVLLRHDGTRAIVRIGHRSVLAPMEWDGQPVFWLGTAADDESLAYLTGLMNGSVRDVKLQAELVDAIALHHTTALVLPILRNLGQHASAEVRMEAVEGVEHHPVAESLQLARDVAARDASPEVRAEAAEAIGALPVAGAVDALVELSLRGAPENVRQEAAEALGELQLPEAVRGIEAVVFGQADEATIAEAVEALGERRENVLPLLRRIIWEHDNAAARVEAVESLAELEGVDVVPLLSEILERHPSVEVQEEALDVLGDIGSEAAWSALMHAAEVSPKWRTRYEGVQAVAEYAVERGEAAEKQAAKLLERMIFSDARFEVQMEALDALAELRSGISRPVLRKVASTHPNREVRAEARDALEGQ